LPTAIWLRRSRGLRRRVKSVRQISPFITVLCFCIGCGSAEGPRFTFSPPDDVRFTVTDQRVTTNNRTADTVYTEVTVHYDIHELADGYMLTGVVESYELRTDTARLQNPLLDAMIGMPIVYQLDDAGRAASVSGYDEVFRRIDSILSPDAARSLKEAYTSEKMAAEEAAQWNARFSHLAGEKLEIGKIVYQEVPYTAWTGDRLSLFEATTITDTLRFDGRLVARLVSEAHSKPQVLARLMGCNLDDIAQRFGLSANVLDSLAGMTSFFDIQTERLVEVATLLSRDIERKKKTVNSAVGSGTRMIQVQTVETSTTRFEY